MSSLPEGSESGAPAISRETAVVFVVDDDVSVRESLESLILSAGWQPETFASAEGFLARSRIDGPSCLVLDLTLPDLNGLDLQKRIVDRVDMPIIFITGYGDVPTTVQAPLSRFRFLSIQRTGPTRNRYEALVSDQRSLVSVVDDDESVRESLPDLLRQFGFAAEAFSSAEAFLTSTVVGETSCLLLDVAMPGMSGPDLQQELTRRRENIPIVFITAHGDPTVRPRLLALGATECLFKPFSDDALLGIVEGYTREAGVRGLERQVGKLLRKVATSLDGGKRALPTTIEVDDVRHYLGRPRFHSEVAERTDTPGIATGLAVTGTGGDVLFIPTANVVDTIPGPLLDRMEIVKLDGYTLHFS